jgi:hypothetical protein
VFPAAYRALASLGLSFNDAGLLGKKTNNFRGGARTAKAAGVQKPGFDRSFFGARERPQKSENKTLVGPAGLEPAT